MGVLACTVCAPLVLVIQGPSKCGATFAKSALCEVQLFHFYIAFVAFAVLNAARQAKIDMLLLLLWLSFSYWQ